MATHGWQVLNGELTFLDVNGDPLAAGQVFFYSPGTTSPKDTFIDQTLVTINTNPVVLDQAGRATVWGSGLYRQIVQDQFGNTQWDLTTGSDPGFDDLEAASATIGSLEVTGNLKVDGTTITNSLTSNGDVQVNGNLNTSGTTTISQISGPVTFGSDVTVGGNVKFASNLNVAGTTDLGGDTNIGGSAGIAGALTVGTTLGVSGNATVDGNFNVGASVGIAGGLTVGTNVGIAGSLTVDGLINGARASALSPAFSRTAQNILDVSDGIYLLAKSEGVVSLRAVYVGGDGLLRVV